MFEKLIGKTGAYRKDAGVRVGLDLDAADIEIVDIDRSKVGGFLLRDLLMRAAEHLENR